MRVHFALALLLAASGCGRQAPGAEPALDGAAVLDLGASDQLEPRPWCNGCRSPAVCVCTLAGSGSLSGDEDGPLARARFSQPRGVAVDHLGAIYLADTGNHRVRVISRGEVRTLAGSGTAGFADGAAATAQFSEPSGVAVDRAGRVYVADTANRRIRLVASGRVSTLAGSSPSSRPGRVEAASPALPSGLKPQGPPDPNHPEPRPEPEPLAPADGPAAEAQLVRPVGVAVDDQGNVFVADAGDERVRVISEGRIRTVAGAWPRGYVDGPVDRARFAGPLAIALDAQNRIYVYDSGRIRMIAGGVVTTLGEASAGPLWIDAVGLAVGSLGEVYLTGAGLTRVDVLRGERVSALAGGEYGYRDGPATDARFGYLAGLALIGSDLLVVDLAFNRVRVITR